MNDNKILKLVYTFFLGLLIAIFVGVGVSTFYAGPKMPEYTDPINYSSEISKEDEKKQAFFQEEYEHYNEKHQEYSRNVSIITLVASVLLLTVSLLYEKKMRVIADGVLLGGLFTLLYSIGRGFASEDSKYSFITVSVGLVVALYLGYHRFVKPEKSQRAPKKK